VLGLVVPFFETALRRPLSKLMTRTTNPTTSSRWIRLPPHMQAETQKPQNQKNNENGPKHVNLTVLICEHLNSERTKGGVVEG
jgi:hypothetical protein